MGRVRVSRDSQGKSWHMDLVFHLLVHYPLLSCCSKPCCQLSRTLAAKNTYPREKKEEQFATMTLGSQFHLT